MTAPICSYSSQAMTQVFTFANIDGAEQNWNQPFRATQINLDLWRAKLALALLATPLLLITSSIETTVYAILLVPAYALSFRDNRPFKHFCKLLESTTFTLYASIFNYKYYQRDFNVHTHESLIRVFLDTELRCPNFFVRPQDRFYYNSIYPTQDAGRHWSVQQSIQQGAQFFNAYILTDHLREDLETVDSDFVHLVLMKAFFTCSVGNASEVEIPSFFKNQTREAITYIREKYRNKMPTPALLEKIERRFSSLDTFNSDQEGDEKDLVSDLRGLVEHELNGIFVKNCWARAFGYPEPVIPANPF